MQITTIVKGDVVLAEVNGQEFHAVVTSDGAIVDQYRKQRGLAIRPLNRNVTITFVTARQVVGHYRRLGQTPVEPWK